jgi:hypothetical protein
MNQTFAKIVAALLLSLGFPMIIGCETTRYIRNAQTHFNQAAQQENELLAKSLTAYQAGANASGTVSSLSDYKMALSLVDRAINENREKLRQEKLLGTAYMIKAMSLWRISDLNGTPPAILELPSDDTSAENSVFSSPERKELIALIPTIKQALNDPETPITLGTRDRVMLIALPGLLDHDRGRLANSMDRADAYFSSAYTVLDEAAGAAPTDHPVHLYLVMAQLQTLNSWAYAIDRFSQEEGMSLETSSKLMSDNVHSRVKNSLCSIKVLWEKNSEIQEQLTKFLFLTGISWKDAVSDCN